MAATISDELEHAGPWNLILGTGTGALCAASGARNMALDHALFEAVRRGAPPVLRLYQWQPACLSFGRNQSARGVYDPDRLCAAGIDVTRRPTGGLEVLHDRELTYSVCAPLKRLGGARAAYATINQALVDGLRRLGVPAALATTAPRRAPLDATRHPCFDAPAAGEVMAHGRKLIGSAQRLEQRTLLQHGSILLAGTQADVLRFRTGNHPATATVGSITLAEILGHAPAAEALITAIAAGFEAVCGTRLAPRNLLPDEASRAAALEDEYRTDAWTWRR